MVRMERLHSPWLLLGPTGAGKLTQARKWIEEAHGTKLALPLESRKFTVGDGYEARVLTSPYHFEIDIPNLSMQDKQIIGELLTTFFSSGDVLNSIRTNTRKLVILRRAHSLSLPAAIRVRAILQQFVLPTNGTGMIWMTAREITGPLALLEDAFVRYRVPRISLTDWQKQEVPELLRSEFAWDRCNGRPERVQQILSLFPTGALPAWPRRIQDFHDEMARMLIYEAIGPNQPTLKIVLWIRGRVYQALSLCQTGPEIIDSCAAAVQRLSHLLEPQIFWKAMKVLSCAEPHTSYRTPLSIESAFLNLYETIRTSKTCVVEKPTALTNELRISVEPVAALSLPAEAGSEPVATKTPAKRRAAPRKKKVATGDVG
jgi:hypothetical protein